MNQSFGELAPHLLRAVAAMGFTQPTPIQVRAMPPVLAGRDVAAEAQTGVSEDSKRLEGEQLIWDVISVHRVSSAAGRE